MASKITSPLSKSPAYQLWTISVLAMLLPPLLALLFSDPSEYTHPAERLIFFCGFFVYQIEETKVFNHLHGLIGYRATDIASLILLFGIVAMWFLILALPAFNQFSLKKRYRLHFLQLVYSTIQSVAGLIFIREHL